MDVAFQLDNLDSKLKRAQALLTMLRMGEQRNLMPHAWPDALTLIADDLRDGLALIAEIAQNPELLRIVLPTTYRDGGDGTTPSANS